MYDSICAHVVLNLMDGFADGFKGWGNVLLRDGWRCTFLKISLPSKRSSHILCRYNISGLRR